jgi:hypothetical protein
MRKRLVFAPTATGGTAGALSQAQPPQAEGGVSAFALGFEMSMRPFETL